MWIGVSCNSVVVLACSFTSHHPLFCQFSQSPAHSIRELQCCIQLLNTMDKHSYVYGFMVS